jgi:hypothetical protein
VRLTLNPILVIRIFLTTKQGRGLNALPRLSPQQSVTSVLVYVMRLKEQKFMAQKSALKVSEQGDKHETRRSITDSA